MLVRALVRGPPTRAPLICAPLICVLPVHNLIIRGICVKSFHACLPFFVFCFIAHNRAPFPLGVPELACHRIRPFHSGEPEYMHREINTCNFHAHPFPRDSCALVHAQKPNYHTLCSHSRTAAPCVRAQKATEDPQFRFIVSFQAATNHQAASCCWKNGCKFGQIDDIRLSGFRSCSVPDFNTACDLRKHKSLFRGATYDAPKQGYLRRQTTDYRRLARIQGSFSNKHPLAHSRCDRLEVP